MSHMMGSPLRFSSMEWSVHFLQLDLPKVQGANHLPSVSLHSFSQLLWLSWWSKWLTYLDTRERVTGLKGFIFLLFGAAFLYISVSSTTGCLYKLSREITMHVMMRNMWWGMQPFCVKVHDSVYLIQACVWNLYNKFGT